MENFEVDSKKEIKNGRGRPKKQNESHEWSDEATEALIYLWNQKEELFQKQHPYFYIREHKERAVESIRQSLAEQGHIVTCNQVLSKFQSLRTYFCSQRNKILASKKFGSSNEEEVESKWRFYKNLTFLDENMKPRETNATRKYAATRCIGGSDGDMDYPHNASMTFVNPTTSLDDGIHFHPDTVVMNHPSHNNNYSQNSMVVVGSHHDTISDYRKSPELMMTDRIHGAAGPAAAGLIEHQPHHLRSSPLSQLHQNGNGSCNSNGSANSNGGKNEDNLFGELVGNMLLQIPSSKSKDLLKLEIQQLIIKTKYDGGMGTTASTSTTTTTTPGHNGVSEGANNSTNENINHQT